jgi:hypothetical protein
MMGEEMIDEAVARHSEHCSVRIAATAPGTCMKHQAEELQEAVH